MRLEQTSTHWLRHTYAKGLAEGMKNGLDTRSVLNKMGDTDARSFNQYVDDEPLKRALESTLTRRRRYAKPKRRTGMISGAVSNPRPLR
jgi:integrase/recombinase XerD